MMNGKRRKIFEDKNVNQCYNCHHSPILTTPKYTVHPFPRMKLPLCIRTTSWRDTWTYCSRHSRISLLHVNV